MDSQIRHRIARVEDANVRAILEDLAARLELPAGKGRARGCDVVRDPATGRFMKP